MDYTDFTYKRMKDDTEDVPEIVGKSDIQEFYAGQTVFLTGATSFLGKCLVEKLLRGCPDLKKIFILMRAKDGESTQQRMEKFFQNTIFEKLLKDCPGIDKKVSAIQGDLMEPGLGLSAKDRETLTQESTIIFHNGAVMNFHVKPSVSLKTNVLGTKAMLDLAAECKNIKVFMYVSTTYSNCYDEKEIEEKFYPSPGDIKMVNDMIAADDDNKSGLTEEALRVQLYPWPNLWSFTKSTSEGIMREYGKKVRFSCGVFRHSIVLSTYREPIRGWCEGGCCGPEGALLAGSLGVLHAVHSKDYPIDVVPVDMAVNGLLVSTWNLSVFRKDHREASIYNYGSSSVNPMTPKKFHESTLEQRDLLPSNKMFWYHMIIFTKCYPWFYILHILTHFIPAAIADLVLMFHGMKPKVVLIFCKLTKNLDKIDYYVNGNWRTNVTEMQKVWSNLNATDKNLFYCDIQSLNWEDYFLTYWTGFRTFMIKDPMNTVESARKKLFKLKLMNYVLVTIFYLVVLYYASKIILPILRIFF